MALNTNCDEAAKIPAGAIATANWEPKTVGVTPANRLTSGGNQDYGSIRRNDRCSDLMDDANG
jgi:hypothetical protein